MGARFESDILQREPGLTGTVHFERVFYSGLLQPNQTLLFDAMKKKEIDFIELRKFFLFGFGDAGSLEHRPQVDGSVYEQAQAIIYQTLEAAYQQTTSDARVIIVAPSLGGQLISNYLWDAQSPNPGQGIWKQPPYQNLPPQKDDRQRLKHLRFIVTTGCNIPRCSSAASPGSRAFTATSRATISSGTTITTATMCWAGPSGPSADYSIRIRRG